MDALPDWLSIPDPPKPKQSKEARQLSFAQFEMVFPRVLDRIYEGYTLADAIKELPIELDVGSFYRWLNSKPERYNLYKEAKEARTEVWAGRIIEIAEGKAADGDVLMEDTSRSKLKIDTYKWLMGADNRRTYGDTKTIDVTTSISITGALEAAKGRAQTVIDAEFTEVLSDEQMKLLNEGEDEDEVD